MRGKRKDATADQGKPAPPAHARATIRDLARRAEGGDKEAVATLVRWLELYPDLRALVDGLVDLATKVERAWVRRLCGTDELSKKAIADDLAALKAELLGPAPSATARILASTVLIAHLAYQRAALAASDPAASPEVRAAREKLMTAAQKRLQDAVRGWDQYAGKAAKGVRPRAGLALFEPDAVA